MVALLGERLCFWAIMDYKLLRAEGLVIHILMLQDLLFEGRSRMKRAGMSFMDLQVIRNSCNSQQNKSNSGASLAHGG